jgi:hypothetical protein
MCDYSLMHVPNRLAQQGETLVTHRFPSGSLGLASPADVERSLKASISLSPSLVWWQRYFNRLLAAPGQVCAVCIPPGARLRILGKEVTFIQTTAEANRYRDAIRFADGRVQSLQRLAPGLDIQVLDLSCAEDRAPVEEIELQPVSIAGPRV